MECLFEKNDLDDLVQDCIISSVLAVEILQSCTKPSYKEIWLYPLFSALSL